jgi:hypothetical protein
MTAHEFWNLRVNVLKMSVRELAHELGWDSERNVERIEAGDRPIARTLELAMWQLAERIGR